MTYNYKKFKSEEYDFSTSQGLQAGDVVSNFKLTALDGGEVSLFTNTGSITVIETGSITCPLYSGNIAKMNALVETYPDIDFKVLYIREAHPGKNIGAHKNLQEKIKFAGDIKNHFPENREIVIDDVDGTAHKQLGLMPDMLLVIWPDRKILYKMDWNNMDTLSKILTNIQNNTPIKNIVPKFRPASIAISLPVLQRAGMDALFEFLTQLPGVILQRAKKYFSSSKSGQF